MMKRVCDRCGDDIKTKKVPEVEIIRWGLSEKGYHDTGTTIVSKELCTRCEKEVLNFINKKK
jgi:Fe2+ or Zn2+ uptake regulation protein